MSIWDRLSKEEGDELRALNRRIHEWVAYCESCRDKRRPIDHSLNLRNWEYVKWDYLLRILWGEIPPSGPSSSVNRYP